MAAKNKVNFTDCAACSCPCKDPRILDCCHIFCLKCLETLLTNETASSIQCPRCETVTAVPGDGPKSLPTNSFVVKLVEMSQLEAEQKRQKLVCSACCRSTTVNKQQQPKAVVYCVDCDDKFCVECQQAHAKFKQTQSHQLVPFGDGFLEKLEGIMKSTPTLCHEHVQPCIMYCKTCSKPVCATCAIGAHKTHEYTDISTVATEGRKTLQGVMDQANRCLENIDKQIENLAAMKKTADDSVENVKKDISSQVSQLNDVIDKHRKELTDIVSYVHLDQVSKISNAETNIKRQIMSVESALAACRELAANGSNVDLCNLATKYIAKADEVLAAPDVEIPGNVELKFTPGKDVREILQPPYRSLGMVYVRETGDS